MKNPRPRILVYVAWEALSFSMLLAGLESGNLVTMVIGTAMAFAYTAAFLMLYVRSEHRVKRALEVVFTFVTLGILISGYAVTGNFILGFITFFVVAMISVAFSLSYLLPRIRMKATDD